METAEPIYSSQTMQLVALQKVYLFIHMFNMPTMLCILQTYMHTHIRSYTSQHIARIWKSSH